MHADARAVVLTADVELLDQALAIATAAGTEPDVVPDAGSLRPLWADAAVVVVGLDQAERLNSVGLPQRTGVYLIGPESARDELCRWSVALGTAAAALPSAAGWLSSAMADAAGPSAGRGQVLSVLGGSGGVGASTIVAGLGVVASRLGLRPVLVDADPVGGGLDLLMGAEQIAGWRWPRLARARGHLGDMTGQLPHVDGVDVLSVSRGVDGDDGGDDAGLGADSMTSVLLSTSRSHDLTVVDLPRTPHPAATAAIRRTDLLLVVVRADVRGLAAARRVLARLPDRPPLGLVLRSRRGSRAGAAAVTEALGATVLGTVLDDWSPRLSAERGDPPARSARSQLARSCRAVLQGLPAKRRAA